MKWHNSKTKLLNRLWLSKQTPKGFTITELLIALLVVTLFVAFALQGMVLASLAQIRARDRAEATLTIQQNLEGIRAIAASYAPAKVPAKQGEQSDFEARCKGIGGNSKKEGMADGLRAAIDADSNLKSEFTAAASRRSYEIQKTLTPRGNVLQITYKVTKKTTDSGPSNPLAEFSTEVIPDVSLQCP